MKRPTIVAVANNKGGVGKTASAYYLARCLGARGIETTLVDCDPQANLTDLLYPDGRPADTLADLLENGTPIVDVLHEAGERIWSIPADGNLADTDSKLVINPLGILRLSNILVENASALGQLVLLDCPPNLGALTTSALIAADYVIVPVLPEPAALEGLGKVVSKLVELRQALRRAPIILGAIATMVEENKLHKEHLERLQGRGMPTLLGCVPKRKGQNRDEELCTTYDGVTSAVLERLG